jgi:hypothetical protein
MDDPALEKNDAFFDLFYSKFKNESLLLCNMLRIPEKDSIQICDEAIQLIKTEVLNGRTRSTAFEIGKNKLTEEIQKKHAESIKLRDQVRFSFGYNLVIGILVCYVVCDIVKRFF